MAGVSFDLLALLVAEPLNVAKLQVEHDLAALVIREPRPLHVRIEHDLFWAKFS